MHSYQLPVHPLPVHQLPVQRLHVVRVACSPLQYSVRLNGASHFVFCSFGSSQLVLQAGAARLCAVFPIQRHMESSCATGNSRPGESGSVHHGSARHGQVDEESKPLCSPCSFFHGSDGCRRGEACRHCHLCPSRRKEQKRRKRMTRALGFKEGRLRLTVPPINDNFCAGNDNFCADNFCACFVAFF